MYNDYKYKENIIRMSDATDEFKSSSIKKISDLASIHKVMAVVIPEELKKTLKLKKGDTLEAKADDKNGL